MGVESKILTWLDGCRLGQSAESMWTNQRLFSSSLPRRHFSIERPYDLASTSHSPEDGRQAPSSVRDITLPKSFCPTIHKGWRGPLTLAAYRRSNSFLKETEPASQSTWADLPEPIIAHWQLTTNRRQLLIILPMLYPYAKMLRSWIGYFCPCFYCWWFRESILYRLILFG